MGNEKKSNPAIPMVKIATAGTSRFSPTDKSIRTAKENKRHSAVLKIPLVAPLTKAIIGSRKRKTGPTSGTKTAAKANRPTADRRPEKELPDAGAPDFLKKEKLLTMQHPVNRRFF